MNDAPFRSRGETTMLRADSVFAAGAWAGEPADSVVLDFDERYRRRLAMTGVGGLALPARSRQKPRCCAAATA